MPRYSIHITTSDGSFESFDLEGVALDRIGAVRALVTETLIEVARARLQPGTTRTITVTAEDGHARTVAQDAVTVYGRREPCPREPSPDDQALWRAMAAMNQVQGG